MPDELDEVVGPAHQFAPLESPRRGLQAALDGIRAQIAQLTKYADALQRDLDALNSAHDDARTTVAATNREGGTTSSSPASKPQGGTKAWRNGR